MAVKTRPTMGIGFVVELYRVFRGGVAQTRRTAGAP
jgi:hypothetical protein